jgi:hypothetical protein
LPHCTSYKQFPPSPCFVHRADAVFPALRNAEFDADFEFVEKVAIKTHAKKAINQKVTEKWRF